MRLLHLAFALLGCVSLCAAEPDSKTPASSPLNTPVPKPPADAPHPRVLLVGGGTSHDFAKVFGELDKSILEKSVGWVDSTQNANGVPEVMPDLDLLVWSSNQPVASGTIKALTDWVDAGKPLVLLHPGIWYNWRNFPDWNKQLVGGGARGHDAYGEFEVHVTQPDHPVTKGLPATYKLTDERYHSEIDPNGTPVDVLVEAQPTASSPKAYPSVWIVKHPKARIVCIALGHDTRSQDNDFFRTLLKNAALWALAK